MKRRRRRDTREKEEIERKFREYMRNPRPWSGMCRLAAWTNAPGGKRQTVHIDAGDQDLRQIFLIHEHPVGEGMLVIPRDPYRLLTPEAEFVVIRARRASMLPFEYVGPMHELDLSRPVLFEDVLITRPEVWDL